MRAVVTGAAGFIGSRLTASLLDAGSSVAGIDRLSDYYDPALKLRNLEAAGRSSGFEYTEADLGEADLDPLLAGADVVFHLAAQPGARGGWGSDFAVYVRDNVLATQRLLAAARRSGASRVVFASSSSVYGEAERYPTSESVRPRPISPYGATKLAAEELCRLYAGEGALELVVLRYFTVFGPGQRPDMAISRFLEAALGDRPIEVFGDGTQERELTYVDDAVTATVAAAERGRSGTTYNIAGGARTTVLGLIHEIGELLGRSLTVVHGAEARGDMRRTAGDASLARAELGFEPETGLRQGLRRQLEAQLAMGHAHDQARERIR